MSRAGKHPIATRLMVVLAATVIVGVTAGNTLDADSGPQRQAPAQLTPTTSGGAGGGSPGVRAGATPLSCGAASATTSASVDTAVAQGIYAAELRSNEVSADVAHITSARALLSALTSGDEAALRAAVHTIVYTPGWHIVRLRVLRAGRVLADVGGPDVVAPVSGVLRSRGRTLGSYVMSVQDDTGYVKLVSRFIGDPVDLYRNGSFLMGTLQPPPSAVSTGASVTVDGDAYQAHVLSISAFPSGSLRVALFVPRPTSAVASAGCPAVRLAAWANIAMHIAARFKPLSAHYQDLVDVLHGATGGPAYVFSGSRRLAGGASQSRIPDRGIVRYGGRSWSVFSWQPSPPVRVFVLTPTT